MTCQAEGKANHLEVLLGSIPYKLNRETDHIMEKIPEDQLGIVDPDSRISENYTAMIHMIRRACLA